MRGEGTRGEEWKEGSMKIDEYDEEGTWGWWGPSKAHCGFGLVGLIASFVRWVDQGKIWFCGRELFGFLFAIFGF
jgi:hypothetical protein